MGIHLQIEEGFGTMSGASGKVVKKRSEKASRAPKREKFVIECVHPVTDGIMDTAALEKYLHDKTKIDGKVGASSNKLTITRDKDTRIIVSAVAPFSKRYLKYLLKKQGLREWFRVIATDKKTYELRYFNIQQD